LTAAMSRVLFGGSAAVLANSGREPFGLVGLETMAAGGLACVGGTGEDYAVPGWNALLLQTDDPREFLTQFEPLAANPREAHAIRRRAVTTARQFLWPAIVRRNLLPRIRFVSELRRAGGGHGHEAARATL
jgi:glycosyltransferase involved in cell wall biosynthesis